MFFKNSKNTMSFHKDILSVITNSLTQIICQDNKRFVSDKTTPESGN